MASGLTHFGASARYGGQITDFIQGPAGTFWFAKNRVINKDKDGIRQVFVTTAIGKVTSDGKTTLFPMRGKARDAGLFTPLPDGTLWFAAANRKGPDGFFGEITPDNKLKKFAVANGAFSTSPNVPPPSADDVWFYQDMRPFLDLSVSPGAFQIVRFTSQGTAETYPVPSDLPGAVETTTVDIQNVQFVQAPDHSLWFLETMTGKDASGNKVDGGGFVRIDTTTGQMRQYMIPENLLPSGLSVTDSVERRFTFSKDGGLYFQADSDSTSEILRMSPAGQFSVVATYPFHYEGLAGPTADSKGNIWFVEGARDKRNGTTVMTAVRSNEAGGLDRIKIKANSEYGTIAGAAKELIPGPDGSMLFVSDRLLVGRISASGKVSYIPIRGISNPNRTIPPRYTLFNSSEFEPNTEFIEPAGNPLVDPQGNLWFVQTGNGLVTRYLMPGGKHH